MKTLTAIFLSLLFFSTHVVAALPDEEKYLFTDLEEVNSFRNWQISGWQAIDARSLIVNISPSDSYLLILDRNLRAIKFTEQIRISSKGSRVRANIDMVHVANQYARPSRIDTIYRLPNREAQQNVRATILAEEIITDEIQVLGEVI